MSENRVIYVKAHSVTGYLQYASDLPFQSLFLTYKIGVTPFLCPRSCSEGVKGFMRRSEVSLLPLFCGLECSSLQTRLFAQTSNIMHLTVYEAQLCAFCLISKTVSPLGQGPRLCLLVIAIPTFVTH